MADATERKPPRFEISAGGVVIRRDPEGPQVALIATQGGSRWALPKGLARAGEALADAAVREVREETGLDAEIVAALKPIDYWFWWGEPGHKARHHKQVHFFLMDYRGGDTSQHDYEVDEARWFPVEEALAKLSYRSERALLAEAIQSL